MVLPLVLLDESFPSIVVPPALPTPHQLHHLAPDSAERAPGAGESTCRPRGETSRRIAPTRQSHRLAVPLPLRLGHCDLELELPRWYRLSQGERWDRD